MSNLVVVAYPDEYRAAEVLAALRRLNSEYLIDLDDACYVTKDARGKLKLHQNTSLAGAGAAWGGMWGMLIGLLFFVPFLGLALGAGLGALSGKLSDYGIDDNFAKQIAANIQPNSSAIFMLIRKSTPDKVVPEMAKFGGTILNKAYSCIPEKSRILFFAPDTPKILYIRYKPAPHQKISQQTCNPSEIEVKGPKTRGRQISIKDIGSVTMEPTRGWDEKAATTQLVFA